MLARYPVVGVVACAAFISIVIAYGASLETLELLAFAGILLFASLVDLDRRIIPNGCIIAAIAVRVVYLVAMQASGVDVFDESLRSLVGMIAIGIGMFVLALAGDALFKRESMGAGDIKLYAVTGFYFGWQQGLLLVMISCFFGLVFAIVRRERTIPFGPSIALAAVFVMLASSPPFGWNLSLL